MNILDVVTNNDGKNVFTITSMEEFNGLERFTLVEAKQDKIDEHLSTGSDFIVISMQELQMFYKKIM